MWHQKHINLSLVPNVHEEQTSEAEPPLSHCGYTRNARLGPEWLASTIQLFCDIKTHCVHSVSCLQGYRNMHTMCRGWVVGFSFVFEKKKNPTLESFSLHSQTGQVTLIKRILTNPEVLTCSAVRHREVIWSENQNITAQIPKRKYKLFCKFLATVCRH